MPNNYPMDADQIFQAWKDGNLKMVHDPLSSVFGKYIFEYVQTNERITAKTEGCADRAVAMINNYLKTGL